jgi:site-specific recombinase XerD
MKMSTAILRYEKEYLVIKGVDKQQIFHYRALGRYWCEIIGDMELKDITLQEISEFRSKFQTYGRHRCNNTVHNYICNIRMLFKYWRLRGEEVMDYTIIPAPRKDPVIPPFLTAEEVDKMILSTDIIRTKFIISLLYASGIRVSELVQLNRNTIKDRTFTVIGKGKKPRICFIDARTELYMEKYLSTRKDRLEALIRTKDGTRASASTIQMIIRNACEKAGIEKKVSPHTLRHSFATNYVSNGGNIRHLADLLGHESLNTTAHYTHIVNNDLFREYKLHHSC